MINETLSLITTAWVFYLLYNVDKLKNKDTNQRKNILGEDPRFFVTNVHCRAKTFEGIRLLVVIYNLKHGIMYWLHVNFLKKFLYRRYILKRK